MAINPNKIPNGNEMPELKKLVFEPITTFFEFSDGEELEEAVVAYHNIYGVEDAHRLFCDLCFKHRDSITIFLAYATAVNTAHLAVIVELLDKNRYEHFRILEAAPVKIKITRESDANGSFLRVMIHTDNQSFEVLQSETETRERFLTTLAREILLDAPLLPEILDPKDPPVYLVTMATDNHCTCESQEYDSKWPELDPNPELSET
jgi:hypothetical protein